VLRDPEVSGDSRRWGEAVFDADGQMDRGKLAAIVFADPPENREELDIWNN
jgi:dephospho-CoA kinase